MSTSHLQGLKPATGLAPLVEDVDERMRLRNAYPGVRGLHTGIGPIDEHLTDELMPGTLTVVAGATGSGKTTFASQVALAFGAQTHALALTLEDRPEDVVNRWLAQIAREDIGDVRNGFSRERPGQGPPATVRHAANELTGLNLTVPRHSAWTLPEIARSVWHWRTQTQAPHGVIIVDQLSELPDATPADWPDWKHLPRPPRVNALECDKLEWKAHLLRELGQLTDCAVVLLAQLNNERDDKGRPTVDSLRGSKGIGHKADNVWLLHRTGDATPDGSYPCEFIVAKARQTRQFKTVLVFDGAQQRFRGEHESRSSRWAPLPGPDAQTLEGRRRLAELTVRRNSRGEHPGMRRVA